MEAVDRACGTKAKNCKDCKIAGKGLWGTSEPKCQLRDGCKYLISEIRLSRIDSLVLKIFLRIPWIEIGTFSKAGIVKRGLNWKQAEVICHAFGIQLNAFILRRLEICQSIILKQEYERIERVEANG